MRNFGEELAYWYLRLNGFFPINDFVLHSSDLESSQNADTDVIGIRNPYTVEKIGMQPETDVCDKLLRFEGKIKEKTVVVISEVKSGNSTSDILLERKDRLEYIVKRTGLFSSEKIEEVTSNLLNTKFYSDNEITVLKIIFAHLDYNNNKKFYYISLKDIENHIIDKFTKYNPEKDSAKLFFPSTLMQYMIWKIRQSTN